MPLFPSVTDQYSFQSFSHQLSIFAGPRSPVVSRGRAQVSLHLSLQLQHANLIHNPIIAGALIQPALPRLHHPPLPLRIMLASGEECVRPCSVMSHRLPYYFARWSSQLFLHRHGACASCQSSPLVAPLGIRGHAVCLLHQHGPRLFFRGLVGCAGSAAHQSRLGGFARHSYVIPRSPGGLGTCFECSTLWLSQPHVCISALCVAVHVHSCGRCGQRRSRSRFRQLGPVSYRKK